MSKSSYQGANVEIATDTFGGLVNKTNQVIYDMGTVVMTTGDVAQPNTTNGAETSGNAHIEGIMSIDTLAVPTTLRGGTVSVPAPLSITSNAIFSSISEVVFDNVGTVNVKPTSNTKIEGHTLFNGLAKTILVDLGTGSTTIDSGSVFINSNTTITTANVEFNVTKFDVNGVFNHVGSKAYLNTANTTIGANNSQDFNVNADSVFNGTTIFNDTITGNAAATFNSTAVFNGNVTLGNAVTDTVTYVSRIASDILPNNNTRDLGSEALPWAEMHGINAYIDADVEAKGELRLLGNLTKTIRSKSTTTAYKDLQIVLETSTGNLKTPMVFGSGNVVSGANAEFDLGTATNVWKNIHGKDLAVANSAVITNALDVVGATTLATAKISDLTSGRVTYAGAGGELVDDSSFRFDGTDLIAPSAKISDLTSGRMVFTTTGGGLVDNATLTFDGSHLTVPSLKVSDLTSGRVALVGLNGELVDDVDITFAGDALTTTNHNVTTNLSVGGTVSLGNSLTGNTTVKGDMTADKTLTVTGATTLATAKISDLTSGRVTYAGAGGELIDSALFTFSANRLTVPNANVTTDFMVGGFVHLGNAAGGDTEVKGSLTVDKDLSILGNTYFAGNASLTYAESHVQESYVSRILDVSGNTIIGSANTDSIAVNARISTDLIPTVDSLKSIGTTTHAWKEVIADTLKGNVDWSYVTNKPDPVVTVSLSGDIAGSASATLTDLTSGTVSIATTVQPNSVALGTDTTGNYVASVVAGGGLDLSGALGEGSTLTLSHSNTSSVGNLNSNNSGGTVIQDIVLSFDTYGHVVSQSVVATNLDNRYAQVAFKTINADGVSVVADAIADTLTFNSGTGVDLAVSATTDTITINSTDTLDSVVARGSSTSRNVTFGNVNAGTMTSGDTIINGDLTVNGIATYVNTETVTIADNIILLNSNETGVPSQDAGFEVERGTSTNKSFVWDESADRWSVGSDHINAGAFIGDLVGNATTATTATKANQLTTARTISLGGDLSGSVSFNGTSNVTITGTVANDSHTHDTRYYTKGQSDGNYYSRATADGRYMRSDVSTSGTDLTLNTLTVNDAQGIAWEGGVNRITHNDGGGNVQIRFGHEYTSTEVFTHTGTAYYIGGGMDSAAGSMDLKVANNGGAGVGQTVSWGPSLTISATDLRWGGSLIWNSGNDGSGSGLDADTLDGLHASSFLGVSATAAAATKLATARTISLGGDLSGSASFNGTANITITAVVADDSHNHTIANVDGLQTALNGKLDNGAKAADSDKFDGRDSTSYSRTDIQENRSTAIRFNDGARLKFGTGEDFQMFHDGTNIIFEHTGPDVYHRTQNRFYFQDSNNGNATRFTMDVNSGDFTATGDITANSDRRLKSNIKTIDNALEKVSKMRGVYFDKEGKASTGVIAQEVEEVLPEVVHTADDDIKSVAYGNIVGVLIESIKELKAEIEELKRNK